MRVDFTEVRKIPIDAVLAHYKVIVRKRSDTELVADCPFPSHEKSAHQKMTLAISIPKNRWFCHSDTCRAASNKPKGGDVIDMVAMMENLVALDAAKKLAQLFSVPSNGEGRAAGIIPAAKPESSTGNKPLAFELKGIDPDHPYIRERGIALETAMGFGVGYFGGKGSMANRVVFPLHENSTLIGYAGRFAGVPPDGVPKWLLPRGLVMSFLWGLEKCDPSKPISITESCWGVLYLYQHGIQATALIGTSMSEAQERLLDPYAEIRICMDNDEPGRTAARKLAEQLKAKHKVTKAYLLEG